MAGLIDAFARPLAIATVAGVFLAMGGAFGSHAAPLGQRTVYWLATMICASLVGTAIFIPAERRGLLDRRPMLWVAILAAIMSAPLTLLVWLMNALFYPRYTPFDIRLAPRFFPTVLLVSVVMTAVNTLAANRARPAPQTHAAPAGAAKPKFLARIPVKLRGGELYAVQAEDHYLRLHTSRGSDLILLRLADALAELEGLEGAQTHRSWWVAKAAVIEARRADGRAVLTLKNGLQAPVSRGYAQALRESGWF